MSRHGEWYVLKRGPMWLRTLGGLSFWPYTAMNSAYVVIGSMLAKQIDWYRVMLIVIVYLLALGISGHALDAAYSKKAKPWGEYLSHNQLLTLVVVPLIPATIIGAYLVLTAAFLWIIAILEAFFLFAYNIEWFSGKFHNDGWFALSWSFLPVMAGYFNLSNEVNALPFLVAAVMSLTAAIEISASRPYKELRKISHPFDWETNIMLKFERILKLIVATVCGIAVWLILSRVI